MDQSDIWSEMILEQRFLHAAGKPESGALSSFGARDHLSDTDIREALNSSNTGMHRAVELLAVEYGYPEHVTFRQLREQLLNLTRSASPLRPAHPKSGSAHRATTPPNG